MYETKTSFNETSLIFVYPYGRFLFIHVHNIIYIYIYGVLEKYINIIWSIRENSAFHIDLV